jgi:putative restriction endonuclease
MKFWWVNHKQTHREEINGGYIWSPKKNKDGSRNQTYDNLSKTHISDTVFSYAHGKIQAIGIVISECQYADRPNDFGKRGEQWDRDGWLVPIIWSRLDTPIDPKSHLSEIRPLLPEKYSPIQPNGNGNQKCYLAEISDDLGSALLRIANSQNGAAMTLQEDLDAILDTTEEAQIIKSEIPETEKEQLIKARRGQGIFRARVEKIETKCRLTGVKDKRFLIASHIKPWRESDSTEKLDGNNGLFLSPHVDRLFDKGWISFSDDGKVLFANHGIRSLMIQWGLNPDINVGDFNPDQRKYLAYHREKMPKD